MTTIGLFEAKTKLSEICERVATKGESVVVTRKGKPLVKIEPFRSSKGESVWARRAEYEKKHGRLAIDFELPRREKQSWRDPLA